MAKITHLSQLDLNQTYSYADYLTWNFRESVELIKGKIMLMSPAPNVRHQRISSDLNGMLYNFFKHKKCQFFAAPFDVRLYDRKKSILANQEIHTVLQPDLCIICNPDLLDQQGCNGAPDWIIEILSKGNSKREMNIKYDLYQEAGVSEYWLVYPEQQAIHQFVLDENGLYQLKRMIADGFAIPSLFPDLKIDLAEIFETWKEE
ncbi:Uma2 family endonuclease [Crenothrix sp.]|uniref:Uma2 family endonuclease n=1 Tax=Crenothrix sp. TaxID=3100433 RepID=UPI00374DFA91